MMNTLVAAIEWSKRNLAEKYYQLLKCQRGDFMDVAVKILIAVVIGALVLGLLYGLWQLVIMPRVITEVNDMFDYTS